MICQANHVLVQVYGLDYRLALLNERGQGQNLYLDLPLPHRYDEIPLENP
jgi:hypothetical protein